jgi:hypothetical protein
LLKLTAPNRPVRVDFRTHHAGIIHLIILQTIFERRHPARFARLSHFGSITVRLSATAAGRRA